ncbi:MAG TPA: STAS domain-containing protein [Chondromyces sp.]|nr:STAS domain-containing protein [Chondromyces sp.]
MNRIVAFSNYLNEHAEQLSEQIVHDIVQQFDKEIPKWELDQAVLVYIELLKVLGQTILEKEDKVPERLVGWSKKNAEVTASKGEKISFIIVRYPPTRTTFIDHLTDISLQLGLSTEEAILIIKRFNCLLDISITETVQAYERYTDEIISKQQKEVMELSAPVVPIQNKLAVLPLIGSITPERATHLLETTVSKIADLRVECLIIDFSGILHIDKVAEAHIFQIYSVLRLLGIEAIATGIRADLAQHLVLDGIDLSSIKTYATVKQAIDSMN